MDSEDDLLNSKDSLFPEWAKSLMDIGFHFAKSVDELRSARVSVAVCLPRIEFGALFTCIGILKWRATRLEGAEGLERLRPMLGTWVSYNTKYESAIGLIQELPTDESGTVKIQRRQGKREPTYDEMSVEQRIRYKHPKAGALSDLLPSDLWSSIKPAGREFNIERGARSDQRRSVELSDAQTNLAEATLGLPEEHWAIAAKEKPVQIFGCKTRLEAEFEESILLQNCSAGVKIGTVLCRSGNLNVQAASHVRIESSKVQNLNPGGLCILEAANSLEDNLRDTSDCNRIILLARSKPSYERYAQSVFNAFLMRKSDLNFSPLPPPYMKIRAFVHK